jgi:hypothetical protein
MVTKEQTPTDDENPAIIYQIVFERWKAGKTLKEICEQTGLDLKSVMTILKEQQKKSLVQKGSKS